MSSEVSADTTDTEQDNTKPEVHSANSWETADLGDKQRNEKFLRLMGATKKEHHGKLVIGENAQAHKRERDRQAESQVQAELAEQFSLGMEHRLAGGRRGHLGLGFHAADSTDATEAKSKGDDDDTEQSATGKPVADSNVDEAEAEGEGEAETILSKQAEDEKCREKDERKRESLDKDGDHEVKKMKFVKSSS